MSGDPTGPEQAPDGADIGPEENRLADAIAAQRPVPRADFRGALGRYLAIRDPGYGPRPARLRAVVSVWIGFGLVLIVIGLLQATGSL
jgi:hypothetical protein